MIRVGPAEYAEYLRVANVGPEWDFNCDSLRFPRLGAHALIPNDRSKDPLRSAALRHLGKVTVRSVFSTRGPIVDSFRTGKLAAIEVDWTGLTGVIPLPPSRLDLDALVVATAPAQKVLAKIYCYDSRQYAERLRQLARVSQAPVREFVVWAEDTVVGAREVTLTGWANGVYGATISGRGVDVEGFLNLFNDAISFVTSASIAPRTIVPEVTQAPRLEMPATRCSLDELRAQARSRGTYFARSAKLNAPPPDGVVFAERDLTLATSGWRGHWTFASARGLVRISGDGGVLDGDAGDAIAVAFDGDIRIDGHKNHISGALLSPRGRIELTGSGNSVRGILLAKRVRMDGSFNLVTDGTDPFQIR